MSSFWLQLIVDIDMENAGKSLIGFYGIKILEVKYQIETLIL